MYGGVAIGGEKFSLGRIGGERVPYVLSSFRCLIVCCWDWVFGCVVGIGIILVGVSITPHLTQLWVGGWLVSARTKRRLQPSGVSDTYQSLSCLYNPSLFPAF